jgi:hypothetical protein
VRRKITSFGEEMQSCIVHLVCCPVAALLVGPKRWLPEEPFDYGWDAIGCNQLLCGRCKRRVQSRLDTARFCRHYECACQSRDEYNYHVIGSDAGDDHEFRTAWHCAGHPALTLPIRLDGIDVAVDGSLGSIVVHTLAHPPFIAQGFRTASFWVQRLYRLLPEGPQRAALGQAVASQLVSSDPAIVRAAIDFFSDIPAANGGEQIAVVAERERDRLRATADPVSADISLYDSLLEAINARLVLMNAGAPADRAALEVARRALLSGEADEATLFRIARIDPAWYCGHTADIVRARPLIIEYALEALAGIPAADRAVGLENIQRIGKAAARAATRWRNEHPELFEREL